MMYSGRIPSYKNNHGENFQTRCAAEPPACVQNAMLTKDKKPFTYTPGGLDLSQIKTPSMARRLNKQQRSLEEEEQPYQNGSYNGGAGYTAPGQPIRGPPAPPPPPPVAPPPPPLVIQAPPSRSPKPSEGERPEIIIPENPIGMLRKTNSPYHWESEMIERQREGPVPKFVEKSATPSPIQPQLRKVAPPQLSYQPPQQFSQEPPQTYQHTQQVQHLPTTQNAQQSPQPNQFMYQPHQPNNFINQSPQPNHIISPSSQSRPFSTSPQPQGFPQQTPQYYNQQSPQPSYKVSPHQSNYQHHSPAFQNSSSAESPIWKPEPKYPSPHQSSSTTPRSPQSHLNDNISVNSTPTRDLLQRQDSQFNKSPAPYTPFSGNSSPYQQTTPLIPSQHSISPSSATSIPSSPWHQPISTNSPLRQESLYSPQKENSFSPGISHYRNSPATQEFYNSPGENTLSTQDNKYSPNRQELQPEQPPQYIYNNVPLSQQNQQNNQKQVQNYSNAAPWRNPHHAKQEPQRFQENNSSPESARFQSHMTIPVTPRKLSKLESVPRISPQRDVAQIAQDPSYYKPQDSPKEVPPWVKAKSEKEKTPPPAWCTRPLENRKSMSRDCVSQEKDIVVQPPWVQKSSDLRKAPVQESAPATTSPSNNQQPPWSQKPSENRKSIPRDMSYQVGTSTNDRNANSRKEDSQVRIIPIQMEVSSKEVQRTLGPNQNQTGRQNNNLNPNQLRIIIDMKNQPGREQQNNVPQYNQSLYNQPNMQSSYDQPQYNQPQQRVTRIVNPQLVRMDETYPPQQQNLQPKTRIIPIQIEPQSPGVAAPKSGVIGARN